MFKAVGIDEVRSGRAAAFDAFVRQHLDQTYRTAALILRDPTAAEDAAHDALVRAWQRWPTLKDPSRFDAWFGRILANACLDRLRREKRRPVVDISDHIAAVRGSDDLARTVADRDALDRAFTRLTPEHRIVVVLRYYLDLPVDAIAERTGVPTGTVKSRLHHALRGLGVALGPAEVEDRR